MKYKVGDCFYLPNYSTFAVIRNVDEQYYNLWFEMAEALGTITRDSMTMYVEKETLIPLKEDSEKERLVMLLKHGR